MKKGLLLPLSLVCLLTLVGCGKKGPQSESKSETESQESVPSEVTPSEPSEVEPSEPSEVEPSEPSEVEPSEPSEVEPSEPSEVEPSESESEEPSESESEEPSESESESEEPVTYAVTITNKTELQAEWMVGEADRSLALSIEPEGNITALINSGEITFASNNEEVATVSGKKIHAVGGGDVKITVTYHDAKDEVDLTITAKPTNKDKFGTVHEGDAEDPFDNEDALKAAKWFKDNGGFTADRFYITGVVDAFYHAPGSRTDKICSWYLQPAEEGGERFEAYQVVKADGSQWSVEDIWVGDTATFEGTFAEYKGQYETGTATIVSVEKLEREAQKTIDATVAEAITVGTALADGMSTYDLYAVTGYVVFKNADGYFLADSPDADTSNLKTLYQVYKPTDLDESFLKFAKVTVVNQLKNYHGQVETTLPVTAASNTVTVLEAGQPWVIVPVEATIAEAIAVIDALEAGATTKDYYKLQGFITSVRYTWSSKYKNVSFYMGATKDAAEADTLYVYGLACTEEEGAKFVAGSEVTVVGNLQKYVKDEVVTKEVLNIVEFEVKEPTPEPDTLPIPVLDKSVITGADAFVYIDNTELKLTVEMLAAATIEVNDFSVALSDETPDEFKDAAQHYVDGADAAVVLQNPAFQLAYANETEILMYVKMDKGLSADWKMRISFTLTATLGENKLESSLVFIGADLVKEGGDVPGDTTKVTFQAVDMIADPEAEYSGGSVKFTSKELDEVVTLTASGTDANTGKIYKSNDYGFQLRLYKSGSGTLTAALKEGYEVVSAKMNYAPKGSNWWAEPSEGDLAIAEGKASASITATSADLAVYSVTIEYAKVGGGETPVELPLPVGNFSGYMVATGDINVFTHIALANELAYVEVYFANGNENNIKVQKAYTYDKATGLVTVELGGNYGNLTATYDPEAGALINVGVDGAAAAMITNNNAATLTNAAKFWSCDEDTDGLRAIFQRRYRANGAGSWTVDNNADHTDRIVSDTTNFVAGTGALSVRPYSGSGNAVGLNLVNDFEATEYKNIGFWVYNSSDTDITFRIWVYTKTGLSGASEIGALTAKANGWTYCRMGFSYGAIYNFNISNWNGSANALVYDNISLF